MRSAVRDALGVMLPTSAQTALLRAVLYRGEEGRRAWEDWLRCVVTPREAIGDEQKGLLPLLYVAAARNRVEPDPEVASWLRAAYFREELRGNGYRRILAETLAALSGQVGRVVVLAGCALSDTVYADACSRHSHGIELLLRPDDFPRAALCLRDIGFRPARRGHLYRPAPRASSWIHASGLPLDLYAGIFRTGRGVASPEALWERARPLPGWEAAMLAPEDALLHVCARAARSGSRTSLRWACDAWLLLDRRRDLDWDLFLSVTRGARLGLPLSVLARYLAEDLAAPVPDDVLTSLDVLAAETGAAALETAVLGALAGSHARMRRVLVSGSDWSGRLALLRCLLAPSPATVLEMGHISDRRQLPAYYVMRPLLYVGRRVARLGVRSIAALTGRLGPP